MCDLIEAFKYLVETDCLTDQSVINSNLAARNIPIEHDVKPNGNNKQFGRVVRNIPLDDDSRWLAIQTVPRTTHDAFGQGVMEAGKIHTQL